MSDLEKNIELLQTELPNPYWAYYPQWEVANSLRYLIKELWDSLAKSYPCVENNPKFDSELESTLRLIQGMAKLGISQLPEVEHPQPTPRQLEWLAKVEAEFEQDESWRDRAKRWWDREQALLQQRAERKAQQSE